MGTQLFKNNAAATLNGTISIGGTTLNLGSGQGARFPSPSAGEYFLITLYEKNGGGAEINYEVVACTARTADALTITRDYEGIVVAAGGTSGGWAYPAAVGINPSQVVYIEMRATAYLFGNVLYKDGNLAGLASPATARTNLGAEASANKDASGGYAGLTLFKLNMRNAANTFTSWFTNTNTASRTYTLPDKDGTVAMTSDITGTTWASPGTIGSTTPNSGAFTTLTSTGAISSGGIYNQSVDYAEVRMRAASGSNLNGWRLTSGINGASDGALAVQHSTDNFAANFTNALVADSSGNVGIGVAPATKLDCFNSGTADTIAQVRNGTASIQIQAGNGYSYINTYTAHPMLFGVGNVERMRIDSGGNVLVSNPAGLGYGTGAGGTVTQATSRTTGVTLNKPTGAITLVSAAGSTSWQSFTVTNSLVAVTDVVRVVQKSGTDKYMTHVTNVAAGSFQITFATTGGTTTEQPVFNFAVIKGATS